MAVHRRPTKRVRRTRVTAESYLLDMRAFPGAKEYPTSVMELDTLDQKTASSGQGREGNMP
jgi:hypothetical protein